MPQGMCLAITNSLRGKVLEMDYCSYKNHDLYIEFMGCMQDGFFILNEYLNHYRIHGENTSGMNLTNRLRDDITGRIRQAEKEMDFYESLKEIIGETDQMVKDTCNIYLNFHAKRRKLLEEGDLIKYIFSIMFDLHKFSSLRILVGDILSIMEQKNDK